MELPCEPTGSLGFDVDAVSILRVLRNSQRRQILITDWSTAPVSANLVLFRKPGLPNSCCWLKDSGLVTVSEDYGSSLKSVVPGNDADVGAGNRSQEESGRRLRVKEPLAEVGRK